MKIVKKVTAKGEWAKKGTDVKNNDIVSIIGDVELITGEYGTQSVCKIQTRNGDKNIRLNQTSLNALVDALGEESSKWINQQVKVTAVKQNVQGKFIDVYYYAHPDWDLGENGFYPPNIDVGGEDIKPEDIPF